MRGHLPKSNPLPSVGSLQPGSPRCSDERQQSADTPSEAWTSALAPRPTHVTLPSDKPTSPTLFKSNRTVSSLFFCATENPSFDFATFCKTNSLSGSPRPAREDISLEMFFGCEPHRRWRCPWDRSQKQQPTHPGFAIRSINQQARFGFQVRFFFFPAATPFQTGPLAVPGPPNRHAQPYRFSAWSRSAVRYLRQLSLPAPTPEASNEMCRNSKDPEQAAFRSSRPNSLRRCPHWASQLFPRIYLKAPVCQIQGRVSRTHPSHIAQPGNVGRVVTE